MKKGFLYGIAIAAALLTGYSAYDAHNKTKMPRMLLANVEALADEAGEATKVGTCYIGTGSLYKIKHDWYFPILTIYSYSIQYREVTS